MVPNASVQRGVLVKKIKRYIATLVYPSNRTVYRFARRIDAVNFLRDQCKNNLQVPLYVILEREEVYNSLLQPFKIKAHVNPMTRRILWRDYNA